MAWRNFVKHPVSSSAGVLCGVVTGAGIALAAFTEMRTLGALMIVGGFLLMMVGVAIAYRKRKPGEPL